MYMYRALLRNIHMHVSPVDEVFSLAWNCTACFLLLEHTSSGRMAFRGRIKGFVLEVCGVVVGKEGGWWMKFEYSRSFRGQSSLGGAS